MTVKFKIRIFSILSIVLFCISMTPKILQNDTFYMIKLGEDILKNGIDLLDHYSWVVNLNYTYPHWLYDIIVFLVFKHFNFFGIYVSNIFLFIILVISIYIINLNVNKDELLATIFSIFFIPCLVPFITARAQVITGILFVWEIYFIEKLISSGKKHYIIILSLISLLVANLHATIWPFYFILFLPYIVEHIFYKILLLKNIKHNKSFKLIIEEIKNFKKLLFSIVIGFFIGFLTPSKICFTYIFKVMLGSSQIYIEEHAPLILTDNILFLICLIVFFLILAFSDLKIKLRELFMIGGLILMSLCSLRHTFFFFTIGLIFLSRMCNRYLTLTKDNTLNILTNMFVDNKFIYTIAFILIILISFIKFYNNYSQEYILKSDYPIDAVNYIKDNLDTDSIRLYNDYNVGSYLLFRDIPVFIDSRCDLYLKEFNGLNYSIFDDAMNIAYNYEEKFIFYDITHALVNNDSILNKLFEKDNKFNVIYNDNFFTLYEVLENEV